jgi:predicted deacylase
VFVAGVHGMEYVPILALQRAAGAIDPELLRGTVVLVHTANMPSFLGRTIYYSPVDGRNLNRVFPGRPDGTLSERIAHVLTTEVVSRATHLVDLHGGDGNESLRPYSYWITTGAPAVAAESRALALAFGLDRIVVDRGRPTDPAASLYLSNTAITRGIPAITTEIGGLGQADEAALALAARGIAGVLRRTGLREHGPAPIAHPKWVVRDEVLRAGATGLFQASVDCGDVVEAGATIGRITDFQGRVLESIRAPFDGELLYVVRTPPVTKGEPLAMVGVLAPQPD